MTFISIGTIFIFTLIALILLIVIFVIICRIKNTVKDKKDKDKNNTVKNRNYKLKNIEKNNSFDLDKKHNLVHKTIINDIPKFLKKTVTNRLNQIIQPKEGYVPINNFDFLNYYDELEIFEYKDNDKDTFQMILGLVVEYTSRYFYTRDIYDSFSNCINGFKIYIIHRDEYSIKNLTNTELKYLNLDFKNKLSSIKNLDFSKCNKDNYEIIRNIFTIIQLDVIYKTKKEPNNIWVKNNNEIKFIFKNYHVIPNYICDNTITLIKRTINFYKTFTNLYFGGVLNINGLITHGEYDFISSDTIWELQVSRYEFKENKYISKATLQILVYYLILKNSIDTEFNEINKEEIKNIGIFNPYTNSSCVLNVSKKINKYYLNEIKNEIIGLNWDKSKKLRIDNIPSIDDIVYNIFKTNTHLNIYTKYTDYETKDYVEKINEKINNYFLNINKNDLWKF